MESERRRLRELVAGLLKERKAEQGDECLVELLDLAMDYGEHSLSLALAAEDPTRWCPPSLDVEARALVLRVLLLTFRPWEDRRYERWTDLLAALEACSATPSREEAIHELRERARKELWSRPNEPKRKPVEHWKRFVYGHLLQEVTQARVRELMLSGPWPLPEEVVGTADSIRKFKLRTNDDAATGG